MPPMVTDTTTANEQSVPARLLLIERDQATAAALAAPLQSRLLTASAMVEARSGREASDLLRSLDFDIVLADLASVSDLSPRTEEAVSRLARLATGALILVFLDAASVSAAMSAMRAGAHECVAKPVSAEALALKIGALALRLGRPRALGVEGPEMIASSRAEDRPVAATQDTRPILPMWQQEQRIIEDAIRSFAGNITLAAAALELSPSTIYRKRQAWADLEQRRTQLALAGLR
jgi:DNA-binding NtrC family response regulator